MDDYKYYFLQWLIRDGPLIFGGGAVIIFYKKGFFLDYYQPLLTIAYHAGACSILK